MKKGIDLRIAASSPYIPRPKHLRLGEAVLFLVLCVSANPACKILEKPEALDNFGLMLVEIDLSAEARGRLESEIADEVPVGAKVEIDGRKFDVKISVAGRSTTQFPKHNYDIHFNGGGYRGMSTLRLSSSPRDTSGVKALIASEVFKGLGTLAPLAEACVVYINRRYNGLYSCMETVDADFFDRRGISILEAYKATSVDSDLSDNNMALPEMHFKPLVRKNNFSYLKFLIENLYKESELNLPLLDTQSIAKYLAASALLNNWDGLVNNYRVYIDSEKKFGLAAWDFDRIYEHEKPGDEKDVNVFWAMLSRNRLFDRFLATESTQKEFKEQIQAQSEILSDDKLDSLVKGQRDRVKKAFMADRFLAKEDAEISYDIDTQNFADSIKRWKAEILKFISQKLP